MTDTVKYVAGLLFDSERRRVALIHKTHGPESVIGKWNAIGGKRKFVNGIPRLFEESSAAMRREFIEEAGVATKWSLFLVLKDIGGAWEVDFYHAFSSKGLSEARTCEEEVVKVFDLRDLPEIVPNLSWIIPMALGHKNDHVWVYEVVEKETFTS